MITLTPEQRRIAAKRMCIADGRNISDRDSFNREIWEQYLDAMDTYVANTNRQEQFQRAVEYALTQV